MSQPADSSIPPEYPADSSIPPEYPVKSALEKLIKGFQKANTRDLHVLVTGRTGSGKSSLVNQLMGYASAETGAFKLTTKAIQEYKLSLQHINFRFFDTPGLGSEDEIGEERLIKSIHETIKYVDCMLYVTPLHDSRVRTDEVDAIKLITKVFGEEMWDKSVIAFTFADRIDPQYYQDNLSQRTRLIKAAIERSVDSEIVKRIPSIGIDNTSQNTPDGKSWLTELCTTVLLRSSVDWKVLLDSLQKLQIMYGDTKVLVQECKESDEGSLVVSINAPFDGVKGETHELLRQEYKHQLRAWEERLVLHREHLNIYREQIEIERFRNAEMLGVIKIMAEKNSSLTAGSISFEVKAMAENKNTSETFNNELQGANIANFANKVADNARQQANQNIYISEQKQTLAEAAAKIQRLLKQLETSNPNASEIEKIAYVSDETTPSLKRRAVHALQAGGEAAIEEFLDNPYINIGKAVIKAWLKPD